MRLTGFREARIDAVVAGDVHLAKDAADLGRQRLSLFALQVEDRDLRTLCGQRAGGGGAEAGRAAGDDCGCGVGDIHRYLT